MCVGECSSCMGWFSVCVWVYGCVYACLGVCVCVCVCMWVGGWELGGSHSMVWPPCVQIIVQLGLWWIQTITATCGDVSDRHAWCHPVMGDIKIKDAWENCQNYTTWYGCTPLFVSINQWCPRLSFKKKLKECFTFIIRTWNRRWCGYGHSPLRSTEPQT